MGQLFELLPRQCTARLTRCDGVQGSGEVLPPKLGLHPALRAGQLQPLAVVDVGGKGVPQLRPERERSSGIALTLKNAQSSMKQ